MILQALGFGGIWFTVCALVTFGIFRNNIKYRGRTIGTILEQKVSSTVERNSKSGRNEKVRVYIQKIEYEVSGIDYHFSVKSKSDRRPGRNVKVAYMIQDPSEAVLQTTVKDYIFVALFWALGVYAVILILTGGV